MGLSHEVGGREVNAASDSSNIQEERRRREAYKRCQHQKRQTPF